MKAEQAGSAGRRGLTAWAAEADRQFVGKYYLGPEFGFWTSPGRAWPLWAELIRSFRGERRVLGWA